MFSFLESSLVFVSPCDSCCRWIFCLDWNFDSVNIYVNVAFQDRLVADALAQSLVEVRIHCIPKFFGQPDIVILLEIHFFDHHKFQ